MKTDTQNQSVPLSSLLILVDTAESNREKMSVKFEHISEMLDKCKNGYTDGLIHNIKCELDDIREVVMA